MGNTLEALHQLQIIETQLAAIRLKREAKSRKVAVHKRRVRDADQKLADNQRICREKQIQLDALSLEVATREEVIGKQREALNSAKTNKAYADILAAINTSKADNAKLESSILQLMEHVQALEAEQVTIESDRAELNTRVSEVEAEFKQFEDEVRAEQERLDAERDACAEGIPPSALAVFTRVALHHDGEAMAPVEKLHPKRPDYACTGCNMKITLEVVNSLHMCDTLQLCNSCGRVLYLETAAAR